MKHKIGVYGSAGGNFETILQKTHELGRVLAENDVILLTGASTGIPYEVIRSAANKNAEIWGFSAALDLESQKKLMKGVDTDIFSKLIYIPKDFPFSSNPDACKKYRNVISTATCDGAIIISGRWGAMNEFTNLHDMGKIIGVLTGTGGIADELESTMSRIKKSSKAKTFFESDPKTLVEKILDEL